MSPTTFFLFDEHYIRREHIAQDEHYIRREHIAQDEHYIRREDRVRKTRSYSRLS